MARYSGGENLCLFSKYTKRLLLYADVSNGIPKINQIINLTSNTVVLKTSYNLFLPILDV